MTGTTNASGEISEVILLEAARHGDLYAWERIVRRYQETVYRISYLIVRDSDLAEKATTSTFLRAYRALPSYQKEIGLTPWLIRIAAGESRQMKRESGRPTRNSRPVERVNGPQFPATVVPGASEAGSLTPAEKEAVTDAFDRLGEEDRLIIASRYLLGLSRRDAADALSLASGLVDDHLQTAVDRLRARMVGT